MAFGPHSARSVIHDVLIVGAGFAGAVMAERLASAGKTVLIIDRRAHLGGNAHDARDAHGHLIHPYGPHLFHTNSQMVVDYLSRFTTWTPYTHRVLARVRGHLLPVPINRTTINRLYGLDLDADGINAFLAAKREARSPVKTSEDVVLSTVGRELYELFFRGYTRKQWGLDPAELDAQVTARIPTRTDDDDRYFTDTFQQMPKAGYAELFSAMLAHPNITIELGTAWEPARHRPRARHLVWTGPIDEFYNRQFGRLAYRSLRFDHEHLPTIDRLQPVAVINEPDEAVPFTRTTEFKHFTGCTAPGTSIVREYPCAEGDPYYPIPRPQHRTTFLRYQQLAEAETTVTFVGRLAQYRYYNMDQVVAAALTQADKLLA